MSSSISNRALQIIGGLLGDIAYLLDARHRRIVRRNLRFAMPEKDPFWVRRTTRKVFQNAATTFLEVLQIATLSKEEVLAKVSIEGGEHLRQARKKGAVIISAHMGNWEMAHIFVACYLEDPLVLIARKVKPEMVNRMLNHVRSRFGSVILDKKGAFIKLVRAIRQGRTIGILIDQGTKLSEGVEVTFFGKKTTATPVAAILARRYGVPVIPAFCIRGDDGSLKLEAGPPLSLVKTSDYNHDITTNTQEMCDVVEDAIRGRPEQWFWFHKRWKRHYPYLYLEDIARKMRQRQKRKRHKKTIPPNTFSD